MNNITKRNRLMAQYQSYNEYLTVCPNEDRVKLMEEMLTIRDQINRIACMTLSDLHKQLDEYYDVKPSKINHENRTQIKANTNSLLGCQT